MKKMVILALVALGTFAGVANAEEWTVKPLKDKMTGKIDTVYASSPEIPIGRARASLKFGCDKDGAIPLIFFNVAPYITGAKTSGKAKFFDARIRWDEKIEVEKLLTSRRSRNIYFTNETAIINKFMKHKKVLIELEIRDSKNYLDFTLAGAKEAIIKARSDCARLQ